MNIESLAYFLFGNNAVIGAHIKKQLKFLEEIVPPSFKQREMDDLGCGDGKITVLLRDIFQPTNLRGYDVNHGLVKRACQRGIDASSCNLEETMPSGELAVIWGVLHHLKDRESCLRKIIANYPLVFIREPLQGSALKWLELGNPLNKETVAGWVNEHLKDAKTLHSDNNVFIFYTAPGYH
ncbi:class I SAM-dependent methyltransferase [Chloroflexota bacterium]